MADPEKDEPFPDITSKLTAPTKQSRYEKEKAALEAKKLKQAKEDAAALKGFLDDFGGPDDNSSSQRGGSGVRARLGDDEPERGSGFMGGKRHHAQRPGGQLRSGPGSLGPMSTYGNNNKKRNFDSSSRDAPPLSRFQKSTEEKAVGAGGIRAAFQSAEDEDDISAQSRAAERELPRPTIRLSMIPPQLSEAEVRAMLPKSLRVEATRTEKQGESRPTQRPSKAIIVTLAADTTNKEIERVIADLRDKYLGWGFHLGISKHISSNALGSNPPSYGPISNILPFGAASKARLQSPPPGQRFAPPPENQFHQGGRGYGRQHEAPQAPQVSVTPPSDFRELRLIHKTIEQVLTHGPEFEALLRKQPDIQQDKEWAWFWNPHSVGGVWYRWQLASLVRKLQTGSLPASKSPQYIFHDAEPWCAPEKDLHFMTRTQFEELVEDASYRQLMDLEDEEQARKGTVDSNTPAFLNPLQKSRLVHLLSRLPTSTSKLRRGDVARITAFAVHNSAGAEEVVDLVISNIVKPFALLCTRRDPKGKIIYPDFDPDQDTSGAKHVGLYIVSDILFAASSTFIGNSWRYRNLFSTAMIERRIFEGLGRLGKDMRWGVMKMNKWKQSMSMLLQLWRSKSAFGSNEVEQFEKAFETSFDEKLKAETGDEATLKPVERHTSERRGSEGTVDARDIVPMETRDAKLDRLRAQMAMLSEGLDDDPKPDRSPSAPRRADSTSTTQAMEVDAAKAAEEDAAPARPAFSMSLGGSNKPHLTPNPTGNKPAKPISISLGNKTAATPTAPAAASSPEANPQPDQTPKKRPKASDLF